MSLQRIQLPETFSFQCTIPIRIADLNYGNHVGNDTVLTLIHEARMQFLVHHGYTEMNMEGCGMIMADAAINFRNELFYGDVVTASVATGEFSRAGFTFFYKLEKNSSNGAVLAAVARTGMICYDYDRKKIVSLPGAARTKLSS